MLYGSFHGQPQPEPVIRIIDTRFDVSSLIYQRTVNKSIEYIPGIIFAIAHL